MIPLFFPGTWQADDEVKRVMKLMKSLSISSGTPASAK